MVHTIRRQTRGWQVKLCNPLKTRAIPERSVMRLADKEALIKCHLPLSLPFTKLYGWQSTHPKLNPLELVRV